MDMIFLIPLVIILYESVNHFHFLGLYSYRSRPLHFSVWCEKISRGEWGFLFVTMYYRIPSKHTADEYIEWVTRSLRVFDGELFFFTDEDGNRSFGQYRARRNIHFITKYKSVWEIPCVSGLQEAYRAQEKLDPEIPLGVFHSKELYAAWNGKSCLLKEISDLYPQSVVFWVDSGMMREAVYESVSFPNFTRLRQLHPDGTTSGKMVFAMFKKWNLKRLHPMTLYTKDVVIGGFFGGDHEAVTRFWEGVWSIHNSFMNRSFIGVDQLLLTTYLVYSDWHWLQPNYLIRRRNSKWLGSYGFLTDVHRFFGRNVGLVNSSDFIH